MKELKQKKILDLEKNMEKEFAQSKFEGKDFEAAWDNYVNCPDFAADGNIFENGYELTEDGHMVLRLVTEFHLHKAFKSMRIIMDDNLKETPKRVAKVWCGDSLKCDTELGGGRFSRPIRIPTFPNTRGKDKWITKEVRIVSTCSHHILPFTGKATISYKPHKFVLGISKLQRLANYIGNRMYLQEDLTKALHEAVRSAADVNDGDVKVEIVAQHSCEKDRGVKNLDCNFYTEE